MRAIDPLGAKRRQAIGAALLASAIAAAPGASSAKPPDCAPGSGKDAVDCPRFALTPDEAAAKAEAERARAIADDLQRSAQRADRQLLDR